jgi:hypothetical protein
LQAFGKAFETLNPGSIARIFTTEVNNEECFDGFCLCFKPQIVRIVRACIRAFTLDACFIKHEQNKLKGWALYTLCSIDSNGNLVCLAHCLRRAGFFSPLPVKMVDERDVFCFPLSQKW